MVCAWIKWNWRRNIEGRRLFEFCYKKKLCVANTWLGKKEQRKITYNMNENESEIDLVLDGKNNSKYLKDA